MSTLLAKAEDLSNAIQARDYEKAKWCLKNGADPNRLLLNEVTPFHLAVTASSAFVNLMLKFGGNPNIPDVDGITPCHVAAQWGKADCLNVLLENGGDMFLVDKSGRNLKWFAQDNEYCKLILEEHFAGMDENKEDITGLMTSPNYADNSPLNQKVETEPMTQLVQSTNSSQQQMHKLCSKDVYKNNLRTEKYSCSECSDSPIRSLLKESSEYNVTPKTIASPSRDVPQPALDATSPDNCFFVLKSNENRKISFNETIKVLPSSNKAISLSNKPRGFNDCNLSDEPESMPEDVCRRLLFSTKQNIDNSNPVSCPPPMSFICPNESDRCTDSCSEESLFTFADSTVPIEESTKNIDNESDVQSCQPFVAVNFLDVCIKTTKGSSAEESTFTLTDSTVPIDESIEKSISESLLDSAKEKDHTHVGLSAANVGTIQQNESSCSQSEGNFQAQQCSNSVSDSAISCSTFPSISVDHKNQSITTEKSLEDSACQGLGKVVYSDRHGYSLIEYTSSPSQSLLSVEDEAITVPLQLSLSIDNPLNDTTILYDWKATSECSSMEELNCTYQSQDTNFSLPARIDNMSDAQLRQNLIKHGFTPGPIKHGRKVYKKKLHLFEQGKVLDSAKDRAELKYSQELRSVLLGKPLNQSVVDDDIKLRKEFDDPQANQCYRGWAAKDSFNYLLLDPRVTKNLPERAKTLSEVETLKTFAGAIFYIGKGKKSRPYTHFKEALHNVKSPASKKIQHIHDIWDKNYGVVSLHVFQNVVDHEAFTREAAMIEAFGLDHLTNCKRGKCYGIAADWNRSRVCRYGTYLVLAAMQIFLLDGERQIRPHQVSNKKTFT